ncbi:MAG: sensor histidine kinase [Bacteroidota bacterium]
MGFPLQSIRARLTFWYTLLVLSTLLAFAVVSYYYTSETLTDNLDISLSNEVRWVKDFIQPQASRVKPSKRSIDALLSRPPRQHSAVADSTGRDSTTQDADEIWNRIFEHTLLSPKKTYIQVADKRGSIIYRSYSLGIDSLVVKDSVAINSTLLATVYHNGEPVRTAVTKDRNFTIMVGYPLEELREALENLYSIFLILIPVALVASIIGGLYLAHKSLKPVEEVTNRARRITAENLDQTIPVINANDEIGRLTITINDMVQRLHDSFAQVKQFSADASHELRTPLTIMRGEIELALRSNKPSEEYRLVLGSALEEILRLTSIIDSLLLLARADQGLYEVHFSEVNLESLVAELYDDSEVLAEPKNIRVTLQKSEPITIVGDKVRLRQLLLNLVDNAIKYTPEGGAVTLAVERRNGSAILKVRDTGIGIPKEDQERVFDRFYRVDKARSREMGGTGLGLSIAKWIVDLHRGSITVESVVDIGSTFTVELPIQ